MKTEKDYSRVQGFPLNQSILRMLFTRGRKVAYEVEQGLPEDSQIVRSYYDRNLHQYFFVVQSQEFERVPEGEPIPFGVLVVRELQGGANEREGAPASAGGEEVEQGNQSEAARI